MKLSKEDLKGIVKECLVEILSEGLGGSSNIVESRSNYQQPRQQAPAQRQTPQIAGRASAQSTQQARPSIYDKLAFTPPRDQVQRSAPTTKKINPLSMVKDITSDPIMAGILAETASSGQHMYMGESNSRNSQPSHEEQVMSAGDAAARKMMMSDPTDLFGDSASKWSSLAFADPIRK
jgi:hypothetical protein